MSLATKCPHCRTTFKVAGDQLKLQAGLVRCGMCQQIFNGREHLVDEDTTSNLPPPLPETVPVEPTQPDTEDIASGQAAAQDVSMLTVANLDAAEEVIILDSGVKDDAFEMEASVEAMKTTDSIISESRTDTDLPPSGVHFSDDSELQAEEISTPVLHPGVNSAINPGDTPSAANDAIEESNAGDIEQLSFIRHARTKNRFRWIWSIGSLVLLLVFIGQATYLFRDLIAATYPPSKPLLITLCNYVGCQIQLPAQLKELSYEADELHTLPQENTFEFSLLMQNHSGFTQAWPHIELALQNSNTQGAKQSVLRRVFTPADYLSNQLDIANGFPAHQEQAVKLYFVVDKVKASDYSVVIFYP